MTSRTFTFAGRATTQGNQVKYRFGNGILKYYQKILSERGETDIALYQTPTPMTKEQAVDWLKSEHGVELEGTCRNFNVVDPTAVKRPVGRPPMSDEQRAAKKALRAANLASVVEQAREYIPVSALAREVETV